MKSFINIFAITALVGFAAVAAAPYHTDDFLHYYDLHEMEHYLEHLVEDHPELVSLETIGQTSEGRDIVAVHVGRHDSDHHGKDLIMVESGLHAREWIAPQVNLYFIHMLVEHPDFHSLFDNIDLVFIPMANPDGFEYSHTTDRNWNKNRRTISADCVGVDLNRNFGFQYKSSDIDTCDEYYSGESAASESETRAIQDFIAKNSEHLKVYLSLQAFGNLIMVPYNYANEQYESQRQLMRLGQNFATAIRESHQTIYRVGPGARLMTPEFGTSSDYAFGEAKVSVAFTIKLPRGGATGFEVPEEDLDQILTETWNGFLRLATLIAGAGAAQPF